MAPGYIQKTCINVGNTPDATMVGSNMASPAKAELPIIDADAYVAGVTPIPEATGFVMSRLHENPAIIAVDFQKNTKMNETLERISTFIEELGRKSVPPQTEVRDNAAGHDLKLADIAAFFNACQNQSNPLTMGEQALLEQLSGTGFLSKCNGIYESTQPAALIGMSRSGVMTPRNEVALHEIAHAYYFVDADFRTDVNAVWSSLKPHEQEFLAGAMVASGFYASGDPEILQTEAHAHSIEKVFEGSGIVNLLIYAEQNCDKAPETKGCSDFWSYRGEIEAFLFSLHNRYAEISECRLPLLPCTPDKKSTTMMTASSIHAAIKDLSYKEVSRTVKGIDALSKLELPPYARRNPSPYARMNMLQARFDQRHHRKKTQ